MRIAYFDCFCGASGDMIIGALLDAGLSLELLKDELARLKLPNYELRVRSVLKQGIGGAQAIVAVADNQHQHRHLHHIQEIIGSSELSEPVKRKSLDVFQRLAEAEASVHRTSIDEIHFHEVGAVDAIIDIVGGVAGLTLLGVEEIYCSPLHVGTGMVKCAHGTLPVPAPATAELIKGKPFYSTGVAGELLTPTGAAILTTLCSGFGHAPPMVLERIGYGAGTAELPIPNLLRVLIGVAHEENITPYDRDRVAILETNIDDMSPQIYDYLIARLLDMGALDVFFSPVQMKKNRPGTLLTVICAPQRTEVFADVLMRETTSIGIRWRIEDRLKARRSLREVQTRYGPVNCKVAAAGDEIINVAPEYEECKLLARKHSIPLKDIVDEVRFIVHRKSPNDFLNL